MLNDDLRLQGEIAETTVPDLLRSLVKSSETGIISLQTFDRHDSIYLKEGKIVFASSSDPDLGLAEVLLKGGELDIQQYNDTVEKSVGRKLGAVLFEEGYLQPEGFMRAVERQVFTIVTDALALRNGEYTIDFADELPREIVSLTIGTERLILDAVGRIEHWSLVHRGIGRMGRVVQQAPNADARIFHLDLSDEESHIYALLNAPESVETICQRSYLNNFKTCRVLWALLAANLLDDTEQAEVSRRNADLEDELNLEGTVERHNSALQAIFGVVFQEIGDHVYDFVDRVVTNLSPDTLPYLSGVNLTNESRVDFDQFLNNLIASGSGDRVAIAGRVMNELLYGWIVEIRKEFGSRLDPKVNPIVDSLKG
jgi:hypothetical protein